ncbi:hypothetical protein KIPB_012924 [Kipferlia bialata]|uniref:Uncharacterized protein n=1 Tax=Kipferlia bialata TaxID=797122 RepID=A0A9K3D788_9EUKA|nr:hypothetical protein KIPB_012924 [Kipferlia bialata]|eukprot:g12924.t1
MSKGMGLDVDALQRVMRFMCDETCDDIPTKEDLAEWDRRMDVVEEEFLQDNTLWYSDEQMEVMSNLERRMDEGKDSSDIRFRAMVDAGIITYDLCGSPLSVGM